MDFIQIFLTLGILLLVSIPVGIYIHKIITGEKSRLDIIFNPIDRFIYRLCGITGDGMNWKQYGSAVLVVNLVMVFFVYLILRLQHLLPFNPGGMKAMEPWLAFHTVISFITNTYLQHYSGEWGVSHLGQMALTFLMFTAPATGFGIAAAFLRGIVGKSANLGNFYIDLTRFITRLLLPFSIIVALLLVWQGVPQTLDANRVVTTIEGKLQEIPLGPVAALESIKNLGSNGGGYFGANSAHPLENPNPFTNFLTILSMGLFATGLVYAFGLMLKNKRQAWVLIGACVVLLVFSVGLVYWAESAGNPILEKLGLSQTMGNMEGKEVRFGIAQSSLFVALTTAYEVGAVNCMHDSLTPMGGLAALWNMSLQVVFGGKGVGFMYMILYALLAVFLCGLMVGRTPEFLGKKLEGREMKLIALVILVHPLLILFPVAVSLLYQSGLAGITNSGFHGFTQILYEYTSAAANNGSGFEGLADNTFFWNCGAGLVMFIGRYFMPIAMLAVAGSLAAKKEVPVNSGTFRTDNVLFGFVYIGIIIIVGALTFFPALALGPIAEFLSLGLR